MDRGRNCLSRDRPRLGMLFPLVRGRCLFRFPVRFLRLLKSICSVFHRLPGMLVAGLMIFFAMMHCGGAVGVCGLLVELGGSLM